MKIPYLIAAVLMLGATTHAHADSAKITVTGKVLPGTCTMNPAPVTLDDIDATDLKAGHENGLKTAELNFTGCVGVASVDLTFDGAADATQDGHWLNQATGGATGVAVALLEGATDDFLKKGDKKTITINGAATGKLEMRAGYYRKSGTLLKAGEVSTSITVTAVYK